MPKTNITEIWEGLEHMNARETGALSSSERRIFGEIKEARKNPDTPQETLDYAIMALSQGNQASAHEKIAPYLK